jgi:hypothetical protein
MPRKRSIHDAYTGHGGQAAVMSELLVRLRNVAVPEVDVGEDLITFRSGEDEPVTRIQVKTANARRLRTEGRYSARVNLPLRQLEAIDRPALHYVFPVRLGDRWVEFLVISRARLFVLVEREDLGYRNPASGELELVLSFRPDDVTCGGRSLHPFRHAWDQLPVFQATSAPAGSPARRSPPSPGARPSP